MMYILLTLFFVSLFGIIFMIGRKFILLNNGHVLEKEKISFEVPYLKEWKHLTFKKMKTTGHTVLVEMIRLYVRSVNFLKNAYKEIRDKIRNRNQATNINGDKKQTSKFLKIISDYKHKIREIKHRIHEEENNS